MQRGLKKNRMQFKEKYEALVLFAIDCSQIQNRAAAQENRGKDLCFGVNLKFLMIHHGDALVKCVNNIEYMNNLQVCASGKMLYPLYLPTCLGYVQF